MESLTTAAQRLRLGDATCVVAGGVESMSNIPFLYNKQGKQWFSDLQSSRTFAQKLKTMSRLKFKFFKPNIALLMGLTDPVCNMLMGMTAENLAREFSISKQEQDEFALDSHLKALKAQEDGLFAHEMMTVVNPKTGAVIESDNGPRKGQTIEALQKLKPYFDRKTGSVTVGTSSQVTTDGAAAMILMTESRAKELGVAVLGYIKSYTYAGCDPDRMGLGPTFAVEKLVREHGFNLKDADIIEINEAFAAQELWRTVEH